MDPTPRARSSAVYIYIIKIYASITKHDSLMIIKIIIYNFKIILIIILKLINSK